MKFIAIILLILTSCGDNKNSVEVFTANSERVKALNPQVDVWIEPVVDTLFDYGENISLSMTLTNNSDSLQLLLFDRPQLSTGGPWGTSVSLVDRSTGLSVLKYSNKAMLGSQLYSLEELEPYFYRLDRSQHIRAKFSLYDLVSLVDGMDSLGRGNYVMQVTYENNRSNVLGFTVR